MRLRSSLLLALASCNAVYGLVEPQHRDGGYFDVTPDVPFTCPNGVVPDFNHAHLEQMIVQNCNDYTRTEAPVRALASCDDVVVMEGVPDQPLSAAIGLERIGNYSFQMPRISPDGDFATMIQVNDASASFMGKVFTARRTDKWTATPAIVMTNTTGISEPSRGPNAHVLTADTSAVIQEYVDTGASWQKVGAPFTMTGLLPKTLHMSPDGLRMWWQANLGIDYADRATIDDVFVHRNVIQHTAGFESPFITADCGRVYFSTLQSIWIAGQQPP